MEEENKQKTSPKQRFKWLRVFLPKDRMKLIIWQERMQDGLFFFGPFVVIGLIVLIGSFFVLRHYFPDLLSPDSAGELVADVDDDMKAGLIPIKRGELPSADVLLSNLVTAQGGRDALEALDSVQVNGEMTINDQVFKFYLTRKAPGRSLLKVKSDRVEVTEGSRDGVHWRRTERIGAPTQYKLLEGDDVTRMGKSLDQIYEPLTAYALSPGAKDNPVWKSEFDGRETYAMRFVHDGRELEAEIDAERFLLLALREELVIDGAKRELLMKLGDYRDVNEVRTAFSTELFLGGELLQTLRVDSMKTNYGVLSSLFDLPEELQSAN